MSEQIKVEIRNPDIDAVMGLMGLWFEILTVEHVIDQFTKAGILAPDGEMWLRKLVAARAYAKRNNTHMVIDKMLMDVCGFDQERATKAVADTEEAGLIAKGPAPKNKRMPDVDKKSIGLVDKYQVTRTDGRPMKGPAIVLEWADPNSLPALQTWASTVRAKGFTALADDVESVLREQVKKRSFSPATVDNMPNVFAAILAADLSTKEIICERLNRLLDAMDINSGDPRGNHGL